MKKNVQNKKAFTLIELLAVIVILAIIALIATPIILNIIEDARKESSERSVELYASAIKNAIAAKQMTGEEITDISQIDNMNEYYDGNVSCTTTDIYADGTIYLAGCTVNGVLLEDYAYGTQQFKTYANGEVVYYRVTSNDAEKPAGKYCDVGEYEANTDKEGNTGCLKFYAFLDDGGDKVNLLLDHNTTALVAWNSSGENKNGPSEVTTQLATDTANWTGVETPVSYTGTGCSEMNDDWTACKTPSTYTVDYSGKKARLITAEEIAEITGNTGWTVGSSYYYFHDLTSNYSTGRGDVCASTGCTYNWLYDKTNTNCTQYGCTSNSTASTYGYWTVSSAASYSNYAWYVYCNGNVVTDYVDIDGIYGVRPVITVLKSKLS